MVSMPLFTSKRERWLWLWAAIVLLTIYGTLSFTKAWAALLRDRNLLDNFFFFAFLLLGFAIILAGLKFRLREIEVGVVLGIVAVYMMVFARMGIPEERTHLIEYSLVAVLIYQALLERKRNGRSVPYPAFIAFLLTSLFGWIDEGIQAILPNRVYDIRDVGFNVLAAFMAIMASVVLRWVHQRFG